MSHETAVGERSCTVTVMVVSAGTRTHLTGPGLAVAWAVMVRSSPSTTSTLPDGAHAHTGPSEKRNH